MKSIRSTTKLDVTMIILASLFLVVNEWIHQSPSSNPSAGEKMRCKYRLKLLHWSEHFFPSTINISRRVTRWRAVRLIYTMCSLARRRRFTSSRPVVYPLTPSSRLAYDRLFTIVGQTLSGCLFLCFMKQDLAIN